MGHNFGAATRLKSEVCVQDTQCMAFVRHTKFDMYTVYCIHLLFKVT